MPFSDTTFSLSGTAVQFFAAGGPATHLLMQWAEGETKAVRRK
jgi:hypothetical protein